MRPFAALSTVADSLPGLGIVAAVLGVVITMGALGGPPEEIGRQGGGGSGGNVLRHSALLWAGGAAGREHGEAGRGRTRLRVRAARGADLIYQGRRSDPGTGIRKTSDSGTRSAELQRYGEILQGRRSGRRCRRGRKLRCRTVPSSSRKYQATEAIMAARGRSHTPIL